MPVPFFFSFTVSQGFSNKASKLLLLGTCSGFQNLETGIKNPIDEPDIQTLCECNGGFGGEEDGQERQHIFDEEIPVTNRYF